MSFDSSVVASLHKILQSYMVQVLMEHLNFPSLLAKPMSETLTEKTHDGNLNIYNHGTAKHIFQHYLSESVLQSGLSSLGS